ncbi:hypothetical protein IM40_01085 [Candidatus Paracaedimonas acanthamoebae]|nr:hypothetical protein IM40_01085 [Candidatus Paracaedimonas acanthamoebae]
MKSEVVRGRFTISFKAGGSIVSVCKRSFVISSSVLGLLRGSPINKAAINVGPDTVISSHHQKLFLMIKSIGMSFKKGSSFMRNEDCIIVNFPTRSIYAIENKRNIFLKFRNYLAKYVL